MSSPRQNRTPDPPDPRECVECGETVTEKRFNALMKLYPPEAKMPQDRPSVPVRCLACAEQQPIVTASIASDPEGLDWVPVKVRDRSALRAHFNVTL